MKKLKLKLDGMKEMLTKEQMKKISGGYSGPVLECCFAQWCNGGGYSTGNVCDSPGSSYLMSMISFWTSQGCSIYCNY